MKTKTKKLYSNIVFIIVCSLMLLTSCQETPNEKIIQSKSNDDISSLIEQDNKSKNDFPTHWDNIINNEKGNLNIVINADIIAGGIVEYPVLSVENKEFTNEFANSIMSALFGEKTLWKYDTLGVSTVTKDAIDMMLSLYTEQLKDKSFNDEEKNSIKENIKWLMYLYPNALDSRYQIPALTEFSDVTSANKLYNIDYEYKYSNTIYGEEKSYEEYQNIREGILDEINEGDALSIEGIVNIGDGREGYINIRKNDSYGNPAKINYYIRSLKEINMETVGEVYREPELTISQEQAYSIAENILKDLGIDYMTLVDDSKDTFFKFVFAREINGTTPNVVYNYAGSKEAYTYRNQVGQESITIYINNDGLKIFEWSYPSEIVEIMTDDVSMIGFDDIKEIFAKQIIINNSYSGEDEKYIDERTIYIEEIKLGSMTIAQSNKSTTNIIVPVWDFYGYEIIKYNDDYLKLKSRYQLDENNERIIQEDEYSYLTISAVNGTIISRYYGY